MPDVQEQLQIIIKAQDEASATLKKVEDAVKKTGASTDDLAKKSAGAGMSVGKMAGAFALGGIVTNALQKGVSFLTDSVRGSLEAYKGAETQAVLTNSVLKTMNTSLDEQKTLFDEAGKAAAKKGFDDEGAGLALAKLYQRTNDMKFAQESLTAAMDLARYKGISLEEATNALGMAYSGNAKVLKQMGVEVEDGRSKLDVLNAVVGKTKGAAEDFSGTIAGKQASLAVAFENLQESVGKAIASAISPYITSMTDAAIRTGDNIGSTDQLGQVVYRVAGAVQVLGSSFVVTGKMVGVVMGAISSMVNNLKALLGGSKDAADLSDEALKNLMEDAAKSAKGVAEGYSRMMGEGYEPAKIAVTELNNVNKDYTAGVQSSINATNKATQAAKEHATAVASAKDKIKEFSDSAVTDFKKVGQSIRNDLTAETARFNDERARVMSDASGNIASVIVSKQDQAADLQRQISEATTDEQRSALQAQLSNITAYLNKHQQDIADNAAAIKTIRDNDLTDEINNIKYQTTLKLAAMDTEHAQKVAKINTQMDDLKTAYKQKFDDMYKELKKSKLFELFDDLENIGSKLMKKKNKSTFETNLADFIGSIAGKRAMGGPVARGGAYLVGEQGPELFQPDVPGKIVSNPESNGVGGATINFNGITVRSDNDIDSIINRILGVLNRKSDLARKGIY